MNNKRISEMTEDEQVEHLKKLRASTKRLVGVIKESELDGTSVMSQLTELMAATMVEHKLNPAMVKDIPAMIAMGVMCGTNYDTCVKDADDETIRQCVRDTKQMLAGLVPPAPEAPEGDDEPPLLN